MQRLWYSLYVAIRFQGILELPGLRSVRSWIYARAFNAPGLFVGHGVVMARPHVGRYTRLAIGRNVRIGSHSELTGIPQATKSGLDPSDSRRI